MPASALSTDNRRGRMWASAPTKMEEFALKLTEQFPTVGDYVMLDYVENGDSRILATLPRRTCFTRREPGCAIPAGSGTGSSGRRPKATRKPSAASGNGARTWPCPGRYGARKNDYLEANSYEYQHET